MAKHACMESERLFLRPVTMHDAVDMFDYTSDEETTRFLYEPHTELQTHKMRFSFYYPISFLPSNDDLFLIMIMLNYTLTNQ